MNKSDTPLTDKHWRDYPQTVLDSGDAYKGNEIKVVDIEFARGLERKLWRARKIIKKLKKK